MNPLSGRAYQITLVAVLVLIAVGGLLLWRNFPTKSSQTKVATESSSEAATKGCTNYLASFLGIDETTASSAEIGFKKQALKCWQNPATTVEIDSGCAATPALFYLPQGSKLNVTSRRTDAVTITVRAVPQTEGEGNKNDIQTFTLPPAGTQEVSLQATVAKGQKTPYKIDCTTENHKTTGVAFFMLANP